MVLRSWKAWQGGWWITATVDGCRPGWWWRHLDNRLQAHRLQPGVSYRTPKTNTNTTQKHQTTKNKYFPSNWLLTMDLPIKTAKLVLNILKPTQLVMHITTSHGYDNPSPSSSMAKSTVTSGDAPTTTLSCHTSAQGVDLPATPRRRPWRVWWSQGKLWWLMVVIYCGWWWLLWWLLWLMVVNVANG